jgi:hypothetical protein
MPTKKIRIAIVLLAGFIWVPIALEDFRGTSAVAFAQDSAASPSVQASPEATQGPVHTFLHQQGPITLWVKGHRLQMPYPECANLITRTRLGEQVAITDAPCKSKLEEALQIDRTEPDIEGVPAINASRPEDQSPPPHAPAARAWQDPLSP